MGHSGLSGIEPDARMPERDEVGVGDLVALLGEERCDVLAGLAAAAGEEDAHGPIQPPIPAGTRGAAPAR